jgi:hypothetical protein
VIKSADDAGQRFVEPEHVAGRRRRMLARGRQDADGGVAGNGKAEAVPVVDQPSPAIGFHRRTGRRPCRRVRVMAAPWGRARNGCDRFAKCDAVCAL